MDVPYEIACTLQYLSNGLAGASYTLGTDGMVTASAVSLDIEGTLSGARSVVATSKKWRAVLTHMVGDLCTSVNADDIDRVEISPSGDIRSIELTLDGSSFSFEYNTVTGVMTTKARPEAVIAWCLYCYLYDTVERWLDTLSEPQ